MTAETLQTARARSEASGRTRSQTCGNCEFRTFAGFCKHVNSYRFDYLVSNRVACDLHKSRDRDDG